MGTRDGLNRRDLSLELDAPWSSKDDVPMQFSTYRKIGGFVVADQSFSLWIPLEFPAELHRNVMDYADAIGTVSGFDRVARILAGTHALQEVGLVG